MVDLLISGIVVLSFISGFLAAYQIWGAPKQTSQTVKRHWYHGAPNEPVPAKKISNALPFPRSIGSWRKQRKELERQHNSQQKERDQRVAPSI
jgi:hypothetical protein